MSKSTELINLLVESISSDEYAKIKSNYKKEKFYFKIDHEIPMTRVIGNTIKVVSGTVSKDYIDGIFPNTEFLGKDYYAGKALQQFFKDNPVVIQVGMGYTFISEKDFLKYAIDVTPDHLALELYHKWYDEVQKYIVSLGKSIGYKYNEVSKLFFRIKDGVYPLSTLDLDFKAHPAYDISEPLSPDVKSKLKKFLSTAPTKPKGIK